MYIVPMSLIAFESDILLFNFPARHSVVFHDEIYVARPSALASAGGATPNLAGPQFQKLWDNNLIMFLPFTYLYFSLFEISLAHHSS